MEVLDAQNWTRWRFWQGASFCARGLFKAKDGPKYNLFSQIQNWTVASYPKRIIVAQMRLFTHGPKQLRSLRSAHLLLDISGLGRVRQAARRRALVRNEVVLDHAVLPQAGHPLPEGVAGIWLGFGRRWLRRALEGVVYLESC